MLRLISGRIIVVAATVEHLSAELQSPQELGILLNAQVPIDWPPGQYDRGAQELFHALVEKDGNSNEGWYSWYAVTRQEPSTVIAAGGFLGPPNAEGEVEIGYSVASAWRNHGYATELVTALITHALMDRRVMKIIAHTTEQNQGSIRVLMRTGFMKTDRTNENGEMRFELLKNGLNATEILSPRQAHQ